MADKKLEEILGKLGLSNISSFISEVDEASKQNEIIKDFIEILKQYQSASSERIKEIECQLKKYKRDVKKMEKILKEMRLNSNIDQMLYQDLMEEYPMFKKNYNGLSTVLPIIFHLEELLKNKTEELLYDPLTKSHNRSYFDDKLPKVIEMLEKKKSTDLTLAMMDVDSFKSINDTYGHQVGDSVLCNIVKIAQEHLPEGASISRYGGEEFALIILEPLYSPIKEKSASWILESIRSDIEKRLISDGKSSPKKVTVTIGATQYRPGDRKIHIVKRADDNLYIGKNAGKNRIILDNDGLNSIAAPYTHKKFEDRLKEAIKHIKEAYKSIFS